MWMSARSAHHQHVEVRVLHVQRDGALPGDHMRMVVRMHPDQRFLCRDRFGAYLRVRNGSAIEHDGRPISLGRRDFTNGVTGIRMPSRRA